MKQKTILMAVACMFLFAAAAFAQSKTNFSGEWTLDVSKSKINNVESGTMSVTQTDKDLTYKSEIKRTPPAGGGGGGGGQGGGGGRGMGGPQTMTYTLDGKETSADSTTPQGMTIKTKLKADWDGGKLKLTAARTFNGPNGEMTRTSKDTWELVDGGKGLKVTRETEGQNGPQSTEMYYTKN